MRSGMRPRLFDLALHLLRLAASAAALAFVADRGPVLIGLASFALFFAAFSLMHDVAHGALRLPRPVNELVLSAAGALLLMSGHALRLSHLRHHARCLEDDDYEGAPARVSLARAALMAPAHALGLRLYAFRGAGKAGRRWQIAETAPNAISMIGLVASGEPALVGYAIAATLGQLTMALWAAHIPHNAPNWLIRAAAPVARIGSVVALSLAYHELHHARPGIPCGRLGSANSWDG
jgi:fatty acid desaturase